MAEKPYPDAVDAADVSHEHDEKHPVQTLGSTEAGGRHKAVALNIVENPLKVSLYRCSRFLLLILTSFLCTSQLNAG